MSEEAANDFATYSHMYARYVMQQTTTTSGTAAGPGGWLGVNIQPLQTDPVTGYTKAQLAEMRFMPGADAGLIGRGREEAVCLLCSAIVAGLGGRGLGLHRNVCQPALPFTDVDGI